MAKELSMNGRKKIGTIQREFSDKFNYLTLIFLDDVNMSIDVSMSLSEARTKKGSDISIIGSLKVGTLEKRFNESFGLKVEVAYSKDGKIFHTKDSVDKTLNELNSWCGENGCERIEFTGKMTRNTLLSLQEQLFNAIKEEFPDAVAKKINKDNYLDIHLPSVHPKKGTHLAINTAGGEIKMFYFCREDDFNTSASSNSERIEAYAKGLRIKGNPSFCDASKAIDAAINFVLELMKVNGNSSISGTRRTKTENTAPAKAASPKNENDQITEKSNKSDSRLAIESYEKGEYEKVIDYFENGGKSFSIQKGNSSYYVYLEKQLDKDGNPRFINIKEVLQSDAMNPPDGITYRKMETSLRGHSASKTNGTGSDFELMIKAFKDGDMERVSEFIKKGSPIPQFSQDGSLIENELITVCVSDPVDLELLNKIIQRGVDLNERNNDSDSYTAVHYCAWDGKTEALSLLLENGASPDIVGEDGRTALHLAAANGFSESVELLLEAGVDIDRRIPNDDSIHYSAYGSTAMREAVFNQFWDVIDLLIEYGADLHGLTEPCIGNFQGKNDLFDVIRLMGKDGQYPEGKYDNERLDGLERMAKGEHDNVDLVREDGPVSTTSELLKFIESKNLDNDSEEGPKDENDK